MFQPSPFRAGHHVCHGFDPVLPGYMSGVHCLGRVVQYWKRLWFGLEHLDAIVGDLHPIAKANLREVALYLRDGSQVSAQGSSHQRLIYPL